MRAGGWAVGKPAALGLTLGHLCSAPHSPDSCVPFTQWSPECSQPCQCWSGVGAGRGEGLPSPVTGTELIYLFWLKKKQKQRCVAFGLTHKLSYLGPVCESFFHLPRCTAPPPGSLLPTCMSPQGPLLSLQALPFYQKVLLGMCLTRCAWWVPWDICGEPWQLSRGAGHTGRIPSPTGSGPQQDSLSLLGRPALRESSGKGLVWSGHRCCPQ